MSSEDGSNGALRDDTEVAILLLSLLCFVSLPNKRLEGPENTKGCRFCHRANILDSQL